MPEDGDSVKRMNKSTGFHQFHQWWDGVLPHFKRGIKIAAQPTAYAPHMYIARLDFTMMERCDHVGLFI